MRSLTIICAIFLTGCAYSGQKFVDESYDEGLLTRKVVGKSKTVAPPFGAKAMSDHVLTMKEGANGEWEIGMGSKDDLDGGELTPEMIQSILSVLRAMP